MYYTYIKTKQKKLHNCVVITRKINANTEKIKQQFQASKRIFQESKLQT